ncbi:hypothetical protein [Methylobacterium sp. WCS2018Hpa-22]|uniref:hypothetical protein n=1 Tax=Methylobacterium sp. WCS2018Hpa-22 TaxID=3073633 RepID=UPI00288C33D9|nr:hypothetical protein [Methylobacterium sp. WCS2018Hpa-22]
MLLEDHEEEWISRILSMTPTELQAADGDMLDFTGRGHVLAYLLNRVPARREALDAKPKVTPDQERASLRAMYVRGTITPQDYVREMGATYLTGHASELPQVGSFHG